MATTNTAIEAERQLLGAAIMEDAAVYKIAPLLPTPKVFLSEGHRHIYEAMLSLARDAHRIDVIAVADVLELAGRLDKCGGIPYLSGLLDTYVPVDNITYHATRLAERYALNETQRISQEIASGAQSVAWGGAASYIEQAAKKLLELEVTTKKELTHVKHAVSIALSEIEHQFEHKGEITGVPTGLADLDKLLAGLHPGELIILAGRPSMGKTAEATGWAINAARFSKKPVAFFSLEMNQTSIAKRVLSSISHIDGSKIRTGFMTHEDMMTIGRAAMDLLEVPLFLSDQCNMSMFEIRAQCRRLQALEGPLAAVFVDYLQFVRDDRRNDSRERAVAEISLAGKALAKEMGCPVVMLAQLNRESEKRQDKRPIMSDLRESGAIEQDADVVIFVYRDEFYNKETDDKGVAENIISKQRNGPTGVVRLRFDPTVTKFSNLIEY